MSFASLDNNDKYTKDAEFARNIGHHYTTYPSNGVKQVALENHRNSNASNAIDFDDDTLKNIQIENGIKFSVLNGAYNNFALNNHQQERSVDTSENGTQLNGFNKSAFGTLSGTAVSSSITMNSQSSPITHTSAYHSESVHNGSAITTARIQTNDTVNSSSLGQRPRNGYTKEALNKAYSNGNVDPMDILNGFSLQRGNRPTEDNPLMQEKISDIFVNRNVGHSKLYNGINNTNNNVHNNNSDNSIYNNKLYNGTLTNNSLDNQANDFGYKNKAFYLHDNTNYVGNETKVYNIFSKQRTVKPLKNYDKGINDSEENGYLSAKIPSAKKSMQSTTRANLASGQQKWGSFEDDELAKILGYVQ